MLYNDTLTQFLSNRPIFPELLQVTQVPKFGNVDAELLQTRSTSYQQSTDINFNEQKLYLLMFSNINCTINR